MEAEAITHSVEEDKFPRCRAITYTRSDENAQRKPSHGPKK